MSEAIKWTPMLLQLASDLMEGKSNKCWLCEPGTGSAAKDVAKHISLVAPSKSRWVEHLCHEHKVELAAELLKVEGSR